MAKHVVWFRQDLRVSDNTALWRACEDPKAEVVGVFCATPQQWAEHDMAPIRQQFIRRNLVTLQRALGDLNIPLVVLEGSDYADAVTQVLRFLEAHSTDAVFINQEYAVNERERDAQFKAALPAAMRCHWHHDFGIAPLGLLTKTGNPYTVFSPYKRAWIERWLRAPNLSNPVPAPRTVASAVVASPIQPPDPLRTDSLWPAGEVAARARLDDFCARRLKAYKAHRDLPALPGTSELSPYLAAGVISPRVCLETALHANDGLLQGGDQGADTWISELIWRDFYIHILDTFPRVSMNRCFRPEGERIPWRDAPDDFRAWCEGRTGYPIVDAAMRQLVQTGWMHNRLRMLVAMFLTKQLLLDWRWGERFFMQHLIDGDLGANNGGWQWAASTGTDAAPYFRIFNPVTQSEKFDASGEFIRRFVPELSELSDKEIHLPPPIIRASLATPYPEPIVELKFARTRALEAFQSQS